MFYEPVLSGTVVLLKGLERRRTAYLNMFDYPC